MIVKSIVPFGAEVSLTADECALLAKICKHTELETNTEHIETLGAAFQALAAAGYALFIAPPANVDEVARAVEAGQLQ